MGNSNSVKATILFSKKNALDKFLTRANELIVGYDNKYLIFIQQKIDTLSGINDILKESSEEELKKKYNQVELAEMITLIDSMIADIAGDVKNLGPNMNLNDSIIRIGD